MKLQLADNDVANRLKHGRLTVTVTSRKTGQHITLRFRCKHFERKRGYITLEEATMFTIDCPSKRNPEAFGDRVGFYTERRGLVPNKGSDPARFWAAEQVLRYITTGELHEQMTLQVEEYCGRCARPLNDPESIRRGLGPECYGEHTKSKHQVHEARKKVHA